MNFLSEVALDYPGAISFASGRPAEQFFELERWMAAVPRFRRHVAQRDGSDELTVGRLLGQYGRAAGIINELVAEQVRKDHGITCCSDQVVVTNGCQEALALCIAALCTGPTDVLLARSPTYIGATGAADFAGVPIVAVSQGPDESFADALSRTVDATLAQGKRPRALYVIPDFDNPTGVVLGERDRTAVIGLCGEHRIAILEDNPYGMFRFNGTAPPAMASLDDGGVVVYLGTYSKTICPAVRVGFAIVPKGLFGSETSSRALKNELGERRSYLTVNTSQLNQAIVGGILLSEGGSLTSFVEPARHFYRLNRDVLIEALERNFGNESGVTWNHPEGGFFLSVHFPFEFGREDMVCCAREYDVLTMPMTFFSLDGAERSTARLSFSNVDPQDIERGVERLSRYVRQRLRDC